jgi:F-type H+-transporting ATPase subunit gamma
MNTFDFQLAVTVGQRVMDDFLSGKVDEVTMVYGEFVSLARQTPVTLPILPIAAVDKDEQTMDAVKEYIYEPTVGGLLAELLPRFINVQIYRGLLDTSASEHAARMMAMDNATKNCDDMTAALTRLYNKTRQAAITKDLMDIVGGVEALKG